jgi:hypothetical protein
MLEYQESYLGINTIYPTVQPFLKRGIRFGISVQNIEQLNHISTVMFHCYFDRAAI